MAISPSSEKFTLHKHHELFGGCHGFKKISKFGWVLDEGKFLTEKEVKSLRKMLEIRKQEAERKNSKTAIRDAFAINLAFFTGLRVMEISQLNICDMVIQNGNSSLIVQSGKNGKNRIVRFGREFREILLEHLEWKKNVGEPCQEYSPLIISSVTKKAMTTRGIQKMYERNAKRAGIKGHSIHHLRHTYASHLYKASKYNLRLIQKQLGHSSIRTTEIYADVFKSDLEIALNKMYRN